MLEEICIIFITIWTCSLAFNLSCPGSGQWNFRAIFYCSDLNKYTCLLDTSKTLYTETCDGPRDEVDGHKSTINRNNFDTAKCSPDRFQPIDFITVGNSDCVFQKSKCAQEGQIAAHEIKEKNSLLDTNCLCDYTKGYSFINLPKDKCYCNPLVSDCSCFREFCPSGKILSPDYQCTTQIDMKNRKWNCSKIASADDSQNGDQVQQSIKDIDPKNERRSRIAVQVIVPILVSIMAGLLIWCKLDKVKERIKCLVCEKGDDNESKTIIIRTETQKSPEKKGKIQHELHEKNNDNELEAIIISTEITLPSDKNDKIQRHSTLSRLSSDRIACDHENCLSTEEIKFLQTDDRTIDLISQTDQHDTPVPEHDDTDSDNQSYKLAYESMTGINQIEDNKSVTYDSTGTSTKSEISKPVFQNGDKEVSRTLENHHSDKGDDSVEDFCTVEDGNAMTSTNDIGDKTEELDEENSMVEAEENKIKKNEELSTFAKEQKDKSDDPVEETCTVVIENEKTSTKQHKDKSDGPGEEICTDEAKNNTIKENRELNTSEEDHIDESEAKKFDTDNKKPFEQDNTDQSDESDAKKSDTDNQKPSEQDNTDQSDELDAKKSDTDNKKPSEEDHIDESDAKKFDTENTKPSDQCNTDHSDESDAKRSDTDNKKPSAQDNTDDNDELDAEKYDTENKKLSKSGTDNQDKRVNTETPNVTENATEENFDILLKGLED